MKNIVKAPSLANKWVLLLDGLLGSLRSELVSARDRSDG